jgi:septum formation protein
VRSFNLNGLPEPAEPAGPPQLILASASPRRQELMTRFFGQDGFVVKVPRFDETAAVSRWLAANNAGSNTKHVEGFAGQMWLDALAMDLPQGKLEALESQFSLPDDYMAVAADTFVCLDGEIFAKPADYQDAARMLGLLSGRIHEVKTGIGLTVRIKGQNEYLASVATTKVKFAELTENQIQWYARTGEPMDKAGAYGIQGYGATLIEWINGCYYNVMGLPVFRLMELLRQAAIRYQSNPFITHLLPWN